MDLPIACSLGPDELGTRTDELAALAARALRSRERIRGGERFTFKGGEETEHDLRAVVAAEAECCAFLRMVLRPAADALVLDVTGPPEADAVIAGLFRTAAAS